MAGAVENVELYIRTDPFLVANGDSFCQVDPPAFVRFHLEREAVLSMVVTRSQDPKEHGMVMVDTSQRITARW